ncbi:hypothetical protein RF55_1693 [Lasius niger]|uniref:Uncharacterized protein n=1 Tax=Lasius niger TaxID=67767 RepID=A0A0J7NZY0_LASNI|nr:hypothetical protein RF55_1693 [Lasius niger]
MVNSINHQFRDYGNMNDYFLFYEGSLKNKVTALMGIDGKFFAAPLAALTYYIISFTVKLIELSRRVAFVTGTG